MEKLSYDDKLRIQPLPEQRLGAKAIASSYPDNGWRMEIEHR